jgi:hypothetical protein
MSTTILSTDIRDLRPHREAVQERLVALRRSVRAQLVLEGLAWFVGTLVLLAALSLAADFAFRFSLATRLLLTCLASMALLVVAYQKLAKPLAVRLEDMDLAVMLDRHLPGVAQRVATVLQLPRLLDGKIQASPSMVRLAVAEQAAALEATSFISVIDSARRARYGALLLTALLAPALFSAFFSDFAGIWVRRWLLASDVRWPQRTYLTMLGLESDRLRVARGEPLTLHVAAKPDTEVPDLVNIRWRSDSGSPKNANFTRFGDNDFRYELPPVHEPLQLSISGGDDWLGPITVEPIDRPTVERLTIRVLHDPARPGGEVRSVEVTDSQLLFLRKTELELEITSHVPLRNAVLTAKTGDAPLVERTDARNYVARWTMTAPLALELGLIGEETGLMSRPYALSIGLLKDREPRVTLRSSGIGQRVTAVARIPLALRALDDFNLRELGLDLDRTMPTDEGPEKNGPIAHIDIDPPGPDELTEADRQITMSLREFAASPGMSLKLRGSAADSCAEGSQTGYSRWLTFRVVTPDELFHEILMRQRVERAKFRAAVGIAKEQAQALETVVDRATVDALIRRHQVVDRQVFQVASRLDAALTELRLNELGSPQALDLLQSQVITPMRQLQTEEMASMQQALARIAGERESEPQVAEAGELQQQIVVRMERILEQMSQWESFVDVVNQVREIIKLQDKVLNSTEETRKKKTQGVFDDP